MKLLEAEFPRLSRLLPPTRTLALLGVAALVVGLELVGRVAQSDVHDGMAASALMAAGALAYARAKRGHSPVRAFAVRRLGRLADHLRGNYGFDLRGDPPFPQRTPSGAWLTLLALLAWTAVAASVWWLCPQGWRGLGVRSSYVAYLVLLSALWTALLAVLVGALFVTVVLIDRQFRTSGRKTQERRTAELAAFILYISAVIMLGRTVPVVTVLGLCAALAVASLVAAGLTRPGTMALLWRSRPGRPIYSVPERRILAGSCAVAALFVGNLILSACGGRLLTMADKGDPMLMTDLIGTTTAWVIPGLVFVAGVTLWRLSAADPGQRTPPTLHWSTDLPLDNLKTCKALLAEGWRVRRRGERRRKGDVAIRVVPASQSEAFEFQPVWPLKVSLADLDNPEVLDRLARRDSLQLRRRAYRGLRLVFSRGYAEKKPKGGYYRFAPHWWHAGSLTYEEPPRRAVGPPTPRRVGPWYSAAFGRRVRQQFHAVLRAVQIDEVVVDEGVPARAVEGVIRALFELYDKHSGTRRAEDHLFRLIPRVRAMIHECQPDAPRLAPRRDGGFDESQYAELSRARVLHVFKDDGEAEELDDAPLDRSWEPAPTLSYR
jgi:hypothetical protein